MKQTRDENADAAHPLDTAMDEELARRAAELVTAWVSTSTPLTESQGWTIIGLQHMGSAQGEMYAWGKLGTWEQQLTAVLAADDGSEESGHRVREAKRAATSDMRDMLLAGIPSGERTNRIWRNGLGPDPREELRRFVEKHAAQEA
ncbi:hypothetical protein ACFZBM_30460 [Streptomyces lavendulae]|uniref:Uncharacterized protein n=1 Tax=Streptomyces lavendulae subsp. lavendulae TaxID=58340 RepID=A0A2K8PRD8_STRLA|nr:hypothetical protein [Streptomyces lavendulae]ATZ29269.1 hypothetical protein SLAV_37520 [Streptomyces lavendulae subsp. lavendulae]QUQ59083.1 hypothetical protein SLLC_35680 [Streptomyces lavendulae subsp. lavendulae]